MNSTISPSIYNKTLPYLKGILFLLAGCYLLNCLSPLRLHVDTLRYFAIKDCIELGCDPNSEAAKDYLPYGYTGLLLFLSKIGLLHSWAIILINGIYLSASIFIISKIFNFKFNLYILGIALLLNWTTIKFFVHPLSEMQYIFVSVLSIYFFKKYASTKKIIFIIVAFGFGLLAFLTRTVGVTLIAALFAGILWEYKTQIIQLIRKHKIIIIIGVLLFIGIIVFSKQLGLTHYTGVLNKQFEEGASIGTVFQWHLQEWTEITLNLSMSKVSSILSASVTNWLFTILGVICFGVVAILFFHKKNKTPIIVKIYFLFYTILMFNWPFYDPRFWVPVLPFVIAGLVTLDYSKIKLPVVKFLGWSYAIAYSAIGIIAIIFMTSTSLNKEKMAQKQANGVYRNDYETYFYGKPLTDTAQKIDTAIVDLLRRHN